MNLEQLKYMTSAYSEMGEASYVKGYADALLQVGSINEESHTELVRLIVKNIPIEQKMRLINRYQEAGYVHELTCGNKSSHRPLVPQVFNGEIGLMCCDCDYKQYWVPECCYFLHPHPLREMEIARDAKK